MNKSFPEFIKRLNNGFFFKQFMFFKLPSAFFAGLRIESFNEKKAVVSVKQKWFNKNPFNSIYFAILTMAGELSTGVLCMGNIYKRKPGISMLVTDQRGLFHKKAVGKISFICEDGKQITYAVDQAIATEDSYTVTCYSKGLNNNNDLIAEFWITWSFKMRKQQSNM